MSLKCWWEVYPQGTKEGDEESRFFIALSRKPEFKYRSVEEISKESGLSKVRVDELIQKYVPTGLVISNPLDPEMWGYWERLPTKDNIQKTIVEEDHDCRVKKCKFHP